MGQTQSAHRVQTSLRGLEGIDAFPVRLTCDDPDAFRLRSTRWTFGDVIVSDTVHTPCVISPADDEDARGEGYVSAFFMLSGSYRLVDTNQSMTFDTGSAGWTPGWNSLAGESRQTSRVMRISVPRESLQGAERGHPPLGRFDNPLMLTTPALAFVRELVNRPDESDPPDPDSGSSPSSDDQPLPRAQDAPAHPAAAVLTQLVSGLFLEQRQYRADHAEANGGLWVGASALIDRQFRDPLLDPAALAAQMHISLRHLQRVFARNGSTISDAIRDRRVEAVAEALADGEGRKLSLSAIALANGFSSIKELRFALRSRHGMTPREFRSASLPTPACG